jgi:hypothetical protein
VGVNAAPKIFYLKINFGYSVEKSQIKKQKYFLNDYLGGVKTEKT